MKPTLHTIILQVLKDAKGWVVSHQLEKTNTPYGWIGTSGLRRCRELEEDGYIENDDLMPVNAPYVSYRITEKGLNRLRSVYGQPPQVEERFRKEIIQQPVLWSAGNISTTPR